MGAGGPPHFEIRESPDPTGGVRLSLIGELDLAAIGALEARLREAKDARTAVRLDLSGLEFLDSSGLRALIEGADDARRDGPSPGSGPEPRLQATLSRTFSGCDGPMSLTFERD